MRFLSPSDLNRMPQNDGDIIRFVHDDVLRDRPDHASRQIIWTNGVNTMPDRHVAAALNLLKIIGGDVVGVYNQTGTLGGWNLRRFQNAVRDDPFLNSFILTVPGGEQAQEGVNAAVGLWNQATGRNDSVTLPTTIGLGRVLATLLGGFQLDIVYDLTQCVLDWCRIMLDLRNDPVVGPFLRDNPAMRRRCIQLYFADNLAVLELFEFLNDNMWPMSRFFLVPHSQGNFVVNGALNAVLVMRGGVLPRGIKVYALTSPSPRWPSVAALEIRLYTNDLDWAPLFSLGTSYGVGRSGSILQPRGWPGRTRPSITWSGAAATTCPKWGRKSTRSTITSNGRNSPARSVPTWACRSSPCRYGSRSIGRRCAAGNLATGNSKTQIAYISEKSEPRPSGSGLPGGTASSRRGSDLSSEGAS